MRAAQLTCFALALTVAPAPAQEQPPCRVLCAPEFHVEPTITFANLFGAPRIADGDGTVNRESRETEFEVILSLGLPTRVRWLEFTVEAIFLPFDRDSTPELEFETNVVWLPGERTRGWVSSHNALAAVPEADALVVQHVARRCRLRM